MLRKSATGRFRNLRLFNVIDDFNGKALSVEVTSDCPASGRAGDRVIGALQQIIFWCGKPQVIRCNNGPENISGSIQNWA